MFKQIVILVFCCIACGLVDAKLKIPGEFSNPLARGFGDNVTWVKAADAERIAKEKNKLIFYVVFKEDDGSCKYLKRQLTESADFQELSDYFVMVNVMDTEPEAAKIQLDGDYVPRILFADSSNKLQPSLYNKNGHKKHKHFFYKSEQVIEAMTFALRSFKKPFKLSSVPIPNTTNLLSRGFGENVSWVSYEYAKEIAKTENKPLFVLIHKSWCGSCKNLKPVLAGSAKFTELSEKFVMVNLEDDEEPKDEVDFRPDGEYIPRIFFLDSQGVTNHAIYNKLGHPNFRFYYGLLEQIIRSMEEAIDVYYNGKVIDPAPEFKRLEELRKQQAEKKEKEKTPEDLEKERAEEEKKKAEAAEKDKAAKEKQQKIKEQKAINERIFLDKTKWVKYENAAKEAQAQSKPILLLVDREESGISKYLREELGGSNEFKELTDKFVMVRIIQEDVNKLDPQLNVDGDYVPRIYFADTNNKVRAELYNQEGKDKFKYYYYGAHQVIGSMNNAIRAYKEGFKTKEDKPKKVSTGANPLARGFGDDIKWVALDEAKELAKSQQKPMLVIIHKTWCGACKKLKPVLAASETFEKLSEKFVMVNLEDDEEPNEMQYKPDGEYIPRILFADSNGRVHPEIYNKKGSQKHKYYYGHLDQLLTSMEYVATLGHDIKSATGEDPIVEEPKKEEKKVETKGDQPKSNIPTQEELKKQLDDIKKRVKESTAGLNMEQATGGGPKMPGGLPDFEAQKAQLDALLKRVEELKKQAGDVQNAANKKQPQQQQTEQEKQKDKKKKKKKNKKDKKAKEEKTEL